MNDIPQELVDRVAEAVHLEAMRPPVSDDDAPTPKTVAEAAIAAMLDGVTLDLDDIHGDGSTLVVKTEAMMPITAMPCGKHHYAGTSHETLDAAKAAVFADYRARLLKAMTGQ